MGHQGFLVWKGWGVRGSTLTTTLTQFSATSHLAMACVQGQVLALRAHCVHTAHAEAGILTQEYLSPV